MPNLLSEAQRCAVCHDTGPAMVFAGPGSGKTTVLTGRVKYLMEEKNVLPSTILVITYTKAAALSMQQRFIREMRGFWPVTFGTFHAVFYHILQTQYHFKADCLLSESGRKLLLYPILKEQHMETEYAEGFLSAISLHKNGKAPEELSLPEGVSKEGFLQVYRAYTLRTSACGKMDFDDMLLKCKALLETSRAAREKWQKAFCYILADEFQDSNRIQFEILKILAYPQNNLFVVGDDDQAIYGFRGASPDLMQQFLREYPQASKYYLEANYRCSKEIVDASGKVISCNQNRVGKRIYAAKSKPQIPDISGVWTKGFEEKRMQYTYLTERVAFLQKWMPFQEMAVLCRTNAEVEGVIPYFKKAGIPFSCKKQGKSRYGHFAVQDVYAYLRLAVRDVERSTFLKIINRPERQIGRECLMGEEIDWAGMQEAYTMCGQKRQAESLALLHRQLKQMGSMSPYLAIRMALHGCGYKMWLQRKAGQDRERYESWLMLLHEIAEEARLFQTIPEWLSFVEEQVEVTKEKKETSKEEKGGVQLMTLHASKGLEFSYVCILQVNEGNIPYGKMLAETAVEEERRLFYVGMTRAKTALDLLYLNGTKERPGQPSRFLTPILKNQSSESSTSSSNS